MFLAVAIGVLLHGVLGGLVPFGGLKIRPVGQVEGVDFVVGKKVDEFFEVSVKEQG